MRRDLSIRDAPLTTRARNGLGDSYRKELSALKERVAVLERRISRLEAESDQGFVVVRKRFASACESIPEVRGAYARKVDSAVELLFDLHEHGIEVTTQLYHVKHAVLQECPELYIRIGTMDLSDLEDSEDVVADYDVIYKRGA